MFKWWMLFLIGLMWSPAYAQSPTERPIYPKPADQFTVEIIYYCATNFTPRMDARLVARTIAAGAIPQVESCAKADGVYFPLEVRGNDLFRNSKDQVLYVTFRVSAESPYWLVGKVISMHLIPSTTRELNRLIKKQTRTAH